MPTSSEFRRWVARLLLSLATAITIAATAYLCAWNAHRNTIHHRPGQHLTRVDLELLREDIERQKETTGSWPARLTDLAAVKEKRVRLDQAGQPLDWWGRPLQYRTEAGGYLLYSHGRDGKPGGVGEDADLYAGQADSPTEPPTLLEFTAMPAAIPVQLACILAGVVAFPLCLLQGKGRAGNRPSLGKVLLANAVTAFFAILAAIDSLCNSLGTGVY
jgi:hypothetical protein